jgi:hypothetical protein
VSTCSSLIKEKQPRRTLRQEADDLGHTEDQVVGRRVLPLLPVHVRGQLQLARVRDKVGVDEHRADGGKPVKALAVAELAPEGTLPFAGRDVVCYDVAEDVVEGLERNGV